VTSITLLLAVLALLFFGGTYCATSRSRW